MSEAPVVLEARNLDLHYPLPKNRVVRAVSNVDLELRRGETLALVGESGCGKSSLSRALMRLEKPTGGTVTLQGEDITRISGEALRQKRRQIQMIFQDPYTSLDPRMTARQIIREPLDNFGIELSRARDGRVFELLDRVGLSERFAGRYPHELSGGQRQRLGIARALAVHPTVLIADEPVSALDVSVRAQVINLLADIQAEQELSILFISHDLGVVSHISERVAVMYLGRIVEIGPTEELMTAPAHPYTRALLDAVPVAHPRDRRQRVPLAGDPPSPIDLPRGCAFQARCPLVQPACRAETPKLSAAKDNHFVACIHAGAHLQE
jgi:oligopeptide/dipeptide ABC transporter ATP-binding protein